METVKKLWNDCAPQRKFISKFIPILLLLPIPWFLNNINTEDKLEKKHIAVVNKSPYIEKYLFNLKDDIGEDLPGYRNHLYRVYSFAQHYLLCDVHYKPSDRNDEIISAALVYHDVGLWTDHSLRYLEPSSMRARKDLANIFSNSELTAIHNIIYWHHKITPYKMNLTLPSDAGMTRQYEKLVNAVRRADWIDASQGVVGMGMPSEHITKVITAIPNEGFHSTLLAFGPRLRGYNFYAIVTELGSIFKY